MRRSPFFVVALSLCVPARAYQAPLAEFLGGAGDQAGSALADAGDLNGDGYADLAVGAPRALTAFGIQDGRVWVASGRHMATGVGPARLLEWEGGPNGGPARARFGHALAVGDIDRDGVGDLVIGAPRDAFGGFDAGSVRIFSGATGLELARFDSTPSQAYGTSVAVAGDVNADGWLDVIAGAPVNETTWGIGYGHAHVLSGEWIARTSAGLPAVTQPELLAVSGTWNHGDFGVSVAGIGDLDGNGADDFAVGAARAGTGNGGYLSIFLNGSTTAFLQVSGAAPTDYYSVGLAGVGDVDGDAIPDVCVGAWGYDAPGLGNSWHGRVEVVSGAWMLATGQGLPTSVARTIWSRAGAAAYDCYGRSVAALADFDLDGAREIAVAGPQTGSGQSAGPGYVDVLSGRTGAVLFRQTGNGVDAQFGVALAGLGDVDGDARRDLALGAPSDAAGGSSAGFVRVVRVFPSVGSATCAAATPNSTGAVARLAARGSASGPARALFLELTQAPPSRAVVFFRGDTITQIPFGNGVRCAGGSLLRFGAGISGPNGALVRAHDVSPFAVGTTFVFQAWFDDFFAGGARFNASDAASLTIAP